MPTPTSSLPNSTLPADAPFDFTRLVACEEEQLRLAGSQGGKALFDSEVSSSGAADEPWLVYTNRDRVGLALSGGGIRSATFNLGFLQALQGKRLLGLFDYVTTVSGGGYVGGFWTAWRLRSGEKVPSKNPADGLVPLLFPKPTEDDLAPPPEPPGAKPKLPPMRDNRERPEIRHLREFSRFLMPRLGLFEVEMWNGVVAVLGGLIPSLAFTAALTALSLLLWVSLVTGMVDVAWPWAALVMLGTTLAIHWPAERVWRKVNPAEKAELADPAVYHQMLAAAGMSGLFVVLVRLVSQWEGRPRGIGPLGWNAGSGLLAEAAVFAPALAWGVAGGVLLLWRFITFSFQDAGTTARLFSTRALDRTIARCLAPALVWAGMGAVWWLAHRIATGGGFSQFVLTGGSAAGLGGAFALLRRWLDNSVKSGGKPGLLDRLKPQLPKLIANATVLVFVIFIAELLVALGVGRGWHWVTAVGVCLLAVAMILRLMDPARVGLHEFYRGRIARCFLGAANPNALKPRPAGDYNRYTHERAADDFTFGDMQARTTAAESAGAVPSPEPLPLRPIHLVCCAANSLGGDPLGTLYRGARSAVLSQRGLSLGNETRQLPDVSFSAALTASASAFNSQMGAISMSLGPAVTFLMAALNLRLGLWLPHPGGGKPLRPAFPGWLFFRELLGWTDAGNSTDADAPKPDYVHLSDGAHFENFGFYELIRRHCRYVMLCDCGADPEGTYDDFAASLRRIREDFGVEVEIDFTPLRRGPDGLSAQHVAVGTIHYDGLTGADKGTLLYFKPVVTGDEPCDVEQYRRMNLDFPQQTTADQFYDAAQWEAHRRLGEHAAHVVFRFTDLLKQDHRNAAERIFFNAVRQWMPGWREASGEATALGERAAQLEAAIRDDAPEFLRAEFFPEAGAKVGPGPADSGEETRALFFLMQITQLMEDAWGVCHLGTEAQHPINEGWLAYISRWAATPSFRRWWPVLCSMYNYNFRLFMNRRYNLGHSGSADPEGGGGPTPQLRLVPVAEIDKAGLASREWIRRGKKFSFENNPAAADGDMVVVRRDRFELRFTLGTFDGLAAKEPLLVGFAAAEVFKDGDASIVRLQTGDFFIPEAFSGCGFIDRFLDDLIAHYTVDGEVCEMRVRLDPEMARPDPNSRLRRVQLIGFCKSRYFVYRRDPAGDTGSEIQELCRDVLKGEAVKPKAATAVRAA